jgi:hypothetical protein
MVARQPTLAQSPTVVWSVDASPGRNFAAPPASCQRW